MGSGTLTERETYFKATIAIVSTLWVALALVVRLWGNNLLDDNRELKRQNTIIYTTLQNKIDSIKRVQFFDLQEQLNEIKNLSKRQDTMNNKLSVIKRNIQ